MHNKPELLSLAACVRRCGLAFQTLRIAIATGVLPAQFVGKTFVVEARDLDAFVRSRKARRPQPAA